MIDLAASGHDAGIRIGELREADMICLRLSSPFRYIIVGSPDYLERRGRPQSLADLKTHDCIRQRLANSGTLMPWRLADGSRSIDVTVKGRVIVNEYATSIALAERGLGLMQVSEPLVTSQLTAGTLEGVLDRFAPTSPGLFLHYGDNGHVVPKLRAFIDDVKAALAAGLLDGVD